MQALSRYREFAADRGAAVITGRPSALSSALLKISGAMERIPQRDLRAHAEMNAFYIFPAGAKNSLSNLFSTHPPMEKRIAALLAAGGAAAGPRRKPRGADGASSTSLLGQAQAQGAGARPAVRDHDGLRRRSTRSRGSRRAASPAIVFQPLATGDFRQIVEDMEEVLRGTGEETGSTVETQGRRVRLPLDDRQATPTSRTSRSASTRSTTRWPVGGYGDRVLCRRVRLRGRRPASRST